MGPIGFVRQGGSCSVSAGPGCYNGPSPPPGGSGAWSKKMGFDACFSFNCLHGLEDAYMIYKSMHDF